MDRNFFSALLFISVTFGCSTVQYNVTAVPEEGGIKFTRITSSEEEAVLGPAVMKSNETDILVWYAAPMVSASQDGKYIAYLAKNNGFSNLYIKEVAGGNKKIQRTFNKDVRDMSFSPDGSKIAFTVDENGNKNIYIMDAFSGARMTQIAAESIDELGPTFNADGSEIYYTAQEFNRYYIWNAITQTGLKTQYSEGFTPVVTPDGSGLLITRNNKDTKFGEIWFIDLKNGTESVILSNPERGFSSPSISPDGQTIACVGVTPKSKNRPQNLDIYTVTIDGTQLTQLTFHGGNDVSPVWGHDGSSIFFISQRGNEKGRNNVWKMML